jgi:hypothetical protein
MAKWKGVWEKIAKALKIKNREEKNLKKRKFEHLFVSDEEREKMLKELEPVAKKLGIDLDHLNREMAINEEEIKPIFEGKDEDEEVEDIEDEEEPRLFSKLYEAEENLVSPIGDEELLKALKEHEHRAMTNAFKPIVDELENESKKREKKEKKGINYYLKNYTKKASELLAAGILAGLLAFGISKLQKPQEEFFCAVPEPQMCEVNMCYYYAQDNKDNKSKKAEAAEAVGKNGKKYATIEERILNAKRRVWIDNNTKKPDGNELELKILNGAWDISGMKGVDFNNLYLLVTLKDGRKEVIKFVNGKVEKYATVYLPSEDVVMAEVVQLGKGKKGDILNVFATYQAPTPQFEQQEQEEQGQGQPIEKTQNIKQKKSKGSIMYAGMFSLDLKLLKAYYEQEKVFDSIEKIVGIYMNEGVKEAREELGKILGYSISNNKFYEFLDKCAGGIRKKRKSKKAGFGLASNPLSFNL